MSGARHPERVGDIAIVLHSHMPYVEGFGTYPFGEEWLFDAFVRSHLPVLAAAEGVTVTVTPVLADQLEAPGVSGRLRDFTAEFRVGSAELDAADMQTAQLRAACLAEADRYRAALGRLDELGDDLLAAFREPAEAGRIELIPSSATHAILPLIATREGIVTQVETGLRSHRRRFGRSRGFWIPECAFEPGLEEILAESGIEWACLDQSAHERPEAALTPIGLGPLTAFTLDWEAIQWLWSWEGYPSFGGYSDFHRKSLRGARPWTIDGRDYDPEAATARAAEQADEFAAAVAGRLAGHRRRSGRAGLLTFAIDTELLGHWWWEGPAWLVAVLERLPEHGVRAITLSEALTSHPGESRPVRRSSWGENKDLRTWDSRPVADFARAARRLELRVLRELLAGRLRGPGAERAVRELLALQASDWAFLDYRKQAGDYPYQRVLAHSYELFEAIDSPDRADPGLRNLAPDLDLAPLLET